MGVSLPSPKGNNNAEEPLQLNFPTLLLRSGTGPWVLTIECYLMHNSLVIVQVAGQGKVHLGFNLRSRAPGHLFRSFPTANACLGVLTQIGAHCTAR